MWTSIRIAGSRRRRSLGSDVDERSSCRLRCRPSNRCRRSLPDPSNQLAISKVAKASFPDTRGLIPKQILVQIRTRPEPFGTFEIGVLKPRKHRSRKDESSLNSHPRAPMFRLTVHVPIKQDAEGRALL